MGPFLLEPFQTLSLPLSISKMSPESLGLSPGGLRLRGVSGGFLKISGGDWGLKREGASQKGRGFERGFAEFQCPAQNSMDG